MDSWESGCGWRLHCPVTRSGCVDCLGFTFFDTASSVQCGPVARSCGLPIAIVHSRPLDIETRGELVLQVPGSVGFGSRSEI